jgi:energy-coupling factor transporter ATP-binding protein EcfA2
MSRDLKIKKAKELQSKYLNERSCGLKRESLTTEREYLVLRKEIIDEVTADVKNKKSISFNDVRSRVQNRKQEPKRETGIRVLDLELVSESKYGRGLTGGFSLGNFIQIAGERGAGKTTLMLKILAGLSRYETISWFNFEMSDEKAVTSLDQFESGEIEYYEGSRELSDIIDEIKYLYSSGVKHFLIDSMMKIDAKGLKRGYESFSHISSKLSELTSTLGINIYLIQQMSSESQRNNTLMMKHGNDAEYDADYMFFVVKATTGENDDAGQAVIDGSKRFLVCTKNRPDHRIFTIEIQKSDIFGIKPEIIEYEG